VHHRIAPRFARPEPRSLALLYLQGIVSEIPQTHTHQFMGTFGGPGNGDYRGELARACLVATCYAKHHQLQPIQILLRLDGEYGNAAVIAVVLRVGSRSSRARSRLCSPGSARSAGGVGMPSRWS